MMQLPIYSSDVLLPVLACSPLPGLVFGHSEPNLGFDVHFSKCICQATSQSPTKYLFFEDKSVFFPINKKGNDIEYMILLY